MDPTGKVIVFITSPVVVLVAYGNYLPILTLLRSTITDLLV